MSWFKEKCRWLNKPSRIAYVFLFPSAVLLLMFNVYQIGRASCRERVLSHV